MILLIYDIRRLWQLHQVLCALSNSTSPEVAISKTRSKQLIYNHVLKTDFLLAPLIGSWNIVSKRMFYWVEYYLCKYIFYMQKNQSRLQDVFHKLHIFQNIWVHLILRKARFSRHLKIKSITVLTQNYNRKCWLMCNPRKSSFSQVFKLPIYNFTHYCHWTQTWHT